MKPELYPRDSHTLSRKEIDGDALKIMERLARNGYKAHLVGGGVRDLLLGKKPKDFDIATDATPRRVKSLFGNSRIIGRRFKLVHVYFAAGKIIEVSTFRDLSDPPEPESDGSEESSIIKSDNKFGTEETDALRRDITINGLFYDAQTRTIIDYVGGMEDLKNGVVRVIGEPDVRFGEDPVRLIRVVRHAARTGFRIDDECAASIRRNGHRIAESSAVRVYEEVKKDLGSGYSLAILRLLQETGLLPHLLPEMTAGMLGEGSLFSEVAERIDDLVRGGEALPTTLMLSVIALFSKNPSEDRPLDRYFESEEDLTGHLAEAFRSLTVTRKERERMEGALALWFGLITEGIEEGEYDLRSYQYEYLDDVTMLLRVLPVTSHDRAVFRLIEQAKKDKEAGPERRRRRGRSRRSRGRGRGREGGENAEHGAQE